MSRREKRKEVKKAKRKQLRREAALVSAQEEGEEDEEAVIRREDEEAVAKERAEHDEQERLWLLREEEARVEWLRKQEEEAERKRKEEERSRKGEDGDEDLDEGWEYVEDGPAEIIWEGNEITVKKPRKKVRKGVNSGVLAVEDKNGPTSNPLPPQSTAFSSYQANTQDVADQTSNFGTEQDKTNCPFYIKQGVCRFGVRCSRLHPVFNEACTLLMRAMYTGAGLALEHVESLEALIYLHTSFTSWRDGQLLRWQHEKEAAICWCSLIIVDSSGWKKREVECSGDFYTDEEVLQEYEEFYDDVHSEFLQFGEIVNFKVCRNGSSHLRGNVYVHYVSRESAVAAYNHMNGRFYAKKQVTCEFVGVTKWKLAICGEFMRTYHKTCSRGSACNFLHCFENPRREYEWADVDRPPPRFWQRKMANLFGHALISDEVFDERPEKSRTHRESTYDDDRRRHRDDRELTYDDDRRKDRHRRETVREDEQKIDRGDRERQFYEDERKDRVRRDSKYDDRQRVRHSKEKSYDSRRRDSTYDDDSARDKSTSRSRYGDDQRSINDERWSPGDEHGQSDEFVHYKDRSRDRHHRESIHDDHHEDNDGDHHSHSRSHRHRHRHRHRSRRRSSSPGSRKTRRSRSRNRSISLRAHSQDDYYHSSEEHEDRPAKETTRTRERASGESMRHRRDSQVGSHTLERTEDADDQRHQTRRHPDRERWSYLESEHQQSVKVLESDNTMSRHSKDLEPAVAGMATAEIASSSVRRLEPTLGFQEANSNRSSTVTGLSVDLSKDDVQQSTSQWLSWRKTKFKKAKLGLKENLVRVIL